MVKQEELSKLVVPHGRQQVNDLRRGMSSKSSDDALYSVMVMCKEGEGSKSPDAFDDQAHTLQHKWRSPKELQTLATSVRFGRQAGVFRPFDLKVKELRSELVARGIVVDNKMLRADLQKSLDQILRGVIRVPALLLANPTQQLA